MAADDRKLLTAFLQDLQLLLERVAEDPRDLIYDRHREMLLLAWGELGRTEAFERLAKALHSSDLDSELEVRGLTGAQLKLKIDGFYYWREQEYREEQALNVPPSRSRRRRKWFRRALRWADIPLGSIASIAGLGVIADPIVEIKDAFLEASEDRDT